MLESYKADRLVTSVDEIKCDVRSLTHDTSRLQNSISRLQDDVATVRTQAWDHRFAASNDRMRWVCFGLWINFIFLLLMLAIFLPSKRESEALAAPSSGAVQVERSDTTAEEGTAPAN